MLYLIEILHQTTTRGIYPLSLPCCILLKFYIKPQLRHCGEMCSFRCILLKFYIKPQLRIAYPVEAVGCILLKFYIKPQLRLGCVQCLDVVSYWNSTSNHNWFLGITLVEYVVSYWNSTSNHNSRKTWSTVTMLYLIEILHQTTTVLVCFVISSGCILLKFYIKPQRSSRFPGSGRRCILLKFYIKPQLHENRLQTKEGCILLKFYIKPQHLFC